MTTAPTITDEMVEAAAGALWHAWLLSPIVSGQPAKFSLSWSDLCALAGRNEKMSAYRETALIEARAALEAAAPVIASAARSKALTEAAYIVSAYGGEQALAIREAIMNARDKE